MARFETIGALAEIKAGYQHRPADELNENGEFLLIQQKDILPDRTRIHYAQAARISPDRKYSRQLLSDGDVVFMNKGHAPFGCAVRKLPKPAIASSAFFILSPDATRILPEYLAWVLNREQTRHELFSAAGLGAMMPVIHRKALEKQPIPLPSLETQRTIAELYRLAAGEKDLMRQLADQKSQLIRGACERLISGTVEL